MASINRPELRFAYRVFITVNILLAVYNMICFQLPRGDIKPCVLVIANLSQQDADSEPKSAPVHTVAATSFVKPQFQNRQPLQSKQSTARPLPAKDSASSFASVTAVAGGGKFEIYGDFIVADESVPFNDSVTLTTQATHEFLQHAPTLCSHWQGPISVAAYSPGTDYDIVLNKIAYLRQCGDPCVRANMTWHIVYDRAHRPAHLRNATDFLASWNDSCSSDVMTREYAEYRKVHKMTYPINVLRNAARTRAKTKYVLASDIELYPSGNIIPRFMRLIKQQPNLTRSHQVFILPIFEVQAKQTAPLTKDVLVKMMRNKTAIFFHKWVCEQCQKFPKRDEWVLYVPDKDKLGILTTTKRDKTKRSWEPIYIGTNDDPLYPEELTWEGKRDKMAQSYELCLKGYDFHILDNAFLVHAPGIKTIIAKEERRRVPFVKLNNAHHARLMNSLKAKYPKLAKDC